MATTKRRYVYKSDVIEIQETFSTLLYGYEIKGAKPKVNEWIHSMYNAFPPAKYGTHFCKKPDPKDPEHRSIAYGYRRAYRNQ